jgi:hypothetical protein
VVFSLLAITFSSCYYDVEEELYATIECDTQMITYSGDVLPILQSECYVCHNAASNFGNITLEGYNNLIKYVNTGQFLGAINHESGFSPMPKNKAQLISCNIEKIAMWISEGAPNN